MISEQSRFCKIENGDGVELCGRHSLSNVFDRDERELWVKMSLDQKTESQHPNRVDSSLPVVPP